MRLKSTDNVQVILDKLFRELNTHDLFYGHGTDNAWDEANWLLSTIARTNADPDGDSDFSVNDEQIATIEEILRRRIEERTPMAYLLGEAWFAGMPFNVDERVLIPRSPIAELISSRFEPLLPAATASILDICCGCGCIGIAAAAAFPDARVDLSDISAGAMEVARSNVERHELTGRVRLVESDLFADITGQYDLILANPPYVSSEEYATLPDEYHREPELALVSGDQGLALPVAILRQAAGYLTERGCLILEVGHDWQALNDRFPELPFLWLDFDFGGEGVCLLTKAQLEAYNFNK